MMAPRRGEQAQALPICAHRPLNCGPGRPAVIELRPPARIDAGPRCHHQPALRSALDFRAARRGLCWAGTVTRVPTAGRAAPAILVR
jgi:hypothetical protein